MSDYQWVFDNPQEAADLIEQQQQRIAELEQLTRRLAEACAHLGQHNDELSATIERLEAAIDVALDQHKRDGAMSASVAYDLEMLLCS